MRLTVELALEEFRQSHDHEIGTLLPERLVLTCSTDADDELEAAGAGSRHPGWRRLERCRVLRSDGQLPAGSKKRVG